MSAQRLAAVRAGASMMLGMVAVTGCIFHHHHQAPVAERVTTDSSAAIDSTTANASAAMPAAATPAPAPAAAAPAAPAPAAPAPAPVAIAQASVLKPAETPVAGTAFSRSSLFASDKGARVHVRTGEHDAAPYMGREGGPRGAGQILGSTEVPGVAPAGPRGPYVIDEYLYVRMPKDVEATPGMRLETFALGPEIDHFGQVMIPTGELIVTKPGGDGEATTVRLRKQYAEVNPDQFVLPLDAPTYPPAGLHAAPVEDGVHASVLYVGNNPVQPAIGYFVVLSANERDGVKLGDQFTIMRARMKDDVSHMWYPDQEIAIAQIVRVGPTSATGVIIAETMPAIHAGADARLTARMP